MVDDLTQESFQTGKAVVTVSVDIINAIADACRESERTKKLTASQKDSLMDKVVDKVTSQYKQTHGSLKAFNREGKDVTHIDVNDERTAEILKKHCKKAHIPVDMKEVSRADGSKTFTAFCEVKSIDQIAALLKNASEQVLEEQKAMTKTLTLYDEQDKAVYSKEFVKDADIDYDKLAEASVSATRFEISNHKSEVMDKGAIESDVKAQMKEKVKEHEPKRQKSLTERIKDKKEQSKKQDKNREREKVKTKSRENSR